MLPTGEQGAEQDEQRTGDRDDANGLAPQRDSERDGHDGDEVDRDRCAWGAYPTDQGGEGGVGQTLAATRQASAPSATTVRAQ